MNLSIVVTSYNNSHNLAKCIDSLLRQEHCRPLESLEIIVVDSGSSDNSQTIALHYGDLVKLIRPSCSSMLPLSAPMARNIGARYAQGEILAFLDGDCAVNANWALQLLQHFRETDIDTVIGSREPDIGKGFGTFIRRYEFILYSNKFANDVQYLLSLETVDKVNDFTLLAANNFAIKRALWFRIGGMRTIYPGEDILLELDILKEGGRILVDPNIVVSHNHPLSCRQLMRRAWENGTATHLITEYSNGLINSRHFQHRGRNFSIPAFIVTFSSFTIVAVVSLIDQLGVQLLSIVAATTLMCFTYQAYVTKRRLARILRLKGERYIRQYQLNIIEVGEFVAGHLLAKVIASVSIICTTVAEALSRNNNSSPAGKEQSSTLRHLDPSRAVLTHRYGALGKLPLLLRIRATVPRKVIADEHYSNREPTNEE